MLTHRAMRFGAEHWRQQSLTVCFIYLQYRKCAVSQCHWLVGIIEHFPSSLARWFSYQIMWSGLMALGVVHALFKDLQFSCVSLWFSVTQLRFFQTVRSCKATSICYFGIVNVRPLDFTHHMHPTENEHRRTERTDMEHMTWYIIQNDIRN